VFDEKMEAISFILVTGMCQKLKDAGGDDLLDVVAYVSTYGLMRPCNSLGCWLPASHCGSPYMCPGHFTGNSGGQSGTGTGFSHVPQVGI
jgi:hypothetical protein